MPSALLIDLDDTLLDDRGSMAKSVLQFRQKHGLADHLDMVARWDAVAREVWRTLARGEVTFQEQRRVRLRQVFVMSVADNDADTLFADYLSFYEENWSLLPGAEEFLEATAHLPRVIVANGHRPQVLRKLEKCGLARTFNGVITPEDCGVSKPDPKIFMHALNLLGAHASEALMIGDDLEADIAPALALGMQVFHVNPAESAQSIRYAYSAA